MTDEVAYHIYWDATGVITSQAYLRQPNVGPTIMITTPRGMTKAGLADRLVEISQQLKDELENTTD